MQSSEGEHGERGSACAANSLEGRGRSFLGGASAQGTLLAACCGACAGAGVATAGANGAAAAGCCMVGGFGFGATVSAAGVGLTGACRGPAVAPPLSVMQAGMHRVTPVFCKCCPSSLSTVAIAFPTGCLKSRMHPAVTQINKNVSFPHQLRLELDLGPTELAAGRDSQCLLAGMSSPSLHSRVLLSAPFTEAAKLVGTGAHCSVK